MGDRSFSCPECYEYHPWCVNVERLAHSIAGVSRGGHTLSRRDLEFAESVAADYMRPDDNKVGPRRRPDDWIEMHKLLADTLAQLTHPPHPEVCIECGLAERIREYLNRDLKTSTR